ncbi:hypothetical protein AAAQ13_03385 [Lactococcus lactis subsp. lactis]|uniref:hypothetical protein n=1 Tax=Lactococcus lactis TaxID=1358 RepID=UPI00071C9848|nr:hypothetical protein [Lactococcus lactis]MBU7533530.1 hypothetical protein [Lactococcus lactis]MBU7541699.1 hypothetical protein [Lactococcus lactis]MDO6178591.1 hypothetical protein [Lactococcus lactis]MDU0410527.1 hypothetical protein [Lactococcus lactis]
MVSDVLEIIIDGLEFLFCGILEIIISIFLWLISVFKWLISHIATVLLTIVITQHQKQLIDFFELSIQILKNHLH